MKIRICVFIALAAVGITATTAYSRSQRQPSLIVRAALKGYSEVPAVSTTGRGAFQATLVNNQIRYRLTYAGLEGTDTLFAHIHFGQHNVNGGVAAFLCGGGGKPDCPDTGGTIENVITADDVVGPTGQGIAPAEMSELLAAIRSGVSYANVHTDKHPPGEIRGQLLPVGRAFGVP